MKILSKTYELNKRNLNKQITKNLLLDYAIVALLVSAGQRGGFNKVDRL